LMREGRSYGPIYGDESIERKDALKKVRGIGQPQGYDGRIRNALSKF
jgi:hypothetical protein